MKKEDLFVYLYALSWQVQIALRAHAMRQEALGLLSMPPAPKVPPAASRSQPPSRERRAARNAYSEALREYWERARPRLDEGMESLRFADQAMIVAVGNVVKFLFPRPAKRGEKPAAKAFRAERGRILRKLLLVDDGAFGETRAIRNSYEHTDEELDSCILEGKGIAIGEFGAGEIETHKTLRGSSANTILSGGKRIQLGPIVTELRRLAASLDQLLNPGTREVAGSAEE